MKSDGLIIAIEFSESLIGDCSGNENAFSVSFTEPKYTPGGAIHGGTRPVISTAVDSSNDHMVLLTFNEGNVNSFRNAVGQITVEYDDSIGTLRGRGGPVSGFSWSFTPSGLEPKHDKVDAEHLSMGLETNVDLIHITYYDTRTREHLEFDINANATLTYIGDL